MLRLIPILVISSVLTGFMPSTQNGQSAMGVRDTIPIVNRRIVEYVQGQIGRKVGRGECWDLAAEALNTAGATWDGFYGFGTVVDWRKQEVLPGDIIQFEEVSIEHRTESTIRRDTYGKHTAIVLEVRGRGDYIVAHQNFEDVRKVTTIELRMSDVRGGKLVFYRPAGE